MMSKFSFCHNVFNPIQQLYFSLYFIEVFPDICLDYFKVVCCRFVCSWEKVNERFGYIPGWIIPKPCKGKSG